MSDPIKPGIHDMPEADYFAHTEALSHSGAKLILDCPAKFRHDSDHPRTDVPDAMSFGSAAHCAVLNPHQVGDLVAVFDFDNWRTKAAQEAKKEAIADNVAPVLRKDWTTAVEMARIVHDHPLAGRLLDNGKAEQSLFWAADDIQKRARLDWMPNVDGERLIVADYKTAKDAEVHGFEKAVTNYGYHSQAAWYSEGVHAVTGIWPTFLFIVQETDAPYVVSVIELSSEMLKIGTERIEHAVRTYKQCMTTGIWPAYSDEVEMATAPVWASIRHEEDLQKWGITT